MRSLDQFLNYHIERLVADQDVPVDLMKLATRTGAVVEEREMIPEAAMDVKDGCFHVYLQSNFKDLPGAALRSRFSLAHEIGHTLFYEQQLGALKPRKDAPTGDRLEKACHKAAAMILVPGRSLRSEIRRREVSTAADIVDLADRFEVSTEVMLRRLNELDGFENGWAPVLTRRIGRMFEIEYAPYPPWLKSHLGKPNIGADFSMWFGSAEDSDGILRRKRLEGSLEAEPLRITDSKTIFELRFRSS